MKTILHTILILFSLVYEIQSQEIVSHLSPRLIVVAEGLNFRMEPNVNSEIIDKLENSEMLNLIEVVKSTNSINNYFYGFEGRWIKVKRDINGQLGYVFGDYIKPQQEAYRRNQGCEKIQKGNWYGIYQITNDVFIEKMNPIIKKSLDNYKYITSDSSKHEFFICSQTKLLEGKINGRIFNAQNDYLKIGVKMPLIRIDQNKYHIVCSGEVELKKGHLYRKTEKLFFLKTVLDGGKRTYFEQEITNSILKYGEVGYKVEFVGDINRDGIPEILLSEGNTKTGTLYYFFSDENGILKLQSLTWTTSKC